MADYRILEFSTYAKIGGTQKMLLEFLRHASHEMYRYALCVLLEHDVLNDEVSQLRLENISLNMRGYWDLSAWWKLYRFAKGKHFDLIRTYGLKADIIGRIVGKLLGIPVNITSVRSTDPWRRWYHVALDVWTAPLTDLYLSNSEAGRLAVQQREGIPASKTMTIPNGVDLSLFDPQHHHEAGTAETYRKALNIPAEVPMLGIVANLCTMKGHDVTIDALGKVREQFPDVKCLFVGSDFLQGQIQRYVREMQMEQTVIFTGFRTDIAELLSTFDIFLLPSLWEGLPTALLEAMAMKKPAIATAVGGVPEIIDNRRTGLLIPHNDAGALADAVIFLLRNPEIAKKLGQAAYEHIHQYFSLQTMVAKTEALYCDLIEKKRMEKL